MKFKRLCIGLIFTLFFTGTCADEVESDETPAKEYVAPSFMPPTIKQDEAYFVDWFDTKNGIGRRWFKSTAKKDGIEENLAMYNGEWFIGMPMNVIVEDDYGLVVKTKARHHAIAANLRKPFEFTGKPLILQYEVKYENGQECGGGYVKLLSAGAEKKISTFNDQTPYTIMFGPDKCGQIAKIHFIIKLRNPKNDTVSEHSVKEINAKSVASYFDDKMTHLYTLKISEDNRYSIQVDNYEIASGSLLKDMIPSVVPPKEIHDPADKKPEDWDERETIPDETAKKPDDWDESQPKEIIDDSATKPYDWLEEEETYIPDPTATKPDDWDEEIDNEWEPKLINNPKCEGISGCGKWVQPMKPNPLYKGKWSLPMISNPAFKGIWAPRLIENPHYYEPDPYKQLEKITAIGFELWTMSSDIIFDNILITDDEMLANRFAAETYTVKREHEQKFNSINNPSTGIFQSLIDATEEKPWLWAVYTVALLIPTILIAAVCFGRKSSSAANPKRTDEVVEDDEFENQEEEEINPEDVVDIEAENVEIPEKDQEEQEEAEKSGKSSVETSPRATRRRARKE